MAVHDGYNLTVNGTQTLSAAITYNGTGTNSDTPTRRINGQGRKRPADRETTPAYWTPYVSGGVSVIPRRDLQNPTFLERADSWRTYATGSPLRLLHLLPEIHPSVGKALNDALRLTCSQDGLTIVANKRSKGRRSKKLQPDDEGTAAIDDLWSQQPSEIGGLYGLQVQLTIEALLSGLVCIEAVPGPLLKGVYRTWPVDALSIGFFRKTLQDDLTPAQRDTFGSYKLTQRPNYIPAGWKELNKQTFFWAAVDPMVDEPYGRAPFAVVLGEVIADLAMIQDLRDAIHSNAWPRLDIGFNFAEMHKVAVDIYGMNSAKKASKWVEEQFELVVEYVQNLAPDDNIVHDSNSKANTIQPGSFAGLEPILNFLRQRIVQALKSLPTLMGINDGSTQTYTSVEWQIYAQTLETWRYLVVQVLLKVANLHLRLLGIDAEAMADYKPIRTTDAFQDAQTLQLEIENEASMQDMGWEDNESSCQRMRGHAPVGKRKKDFTPGQGKAQQQDGRTGPDATPSEKKAAKQAQDGK